MVIKCPKCNHYVSDTTEVCPHCGAILKEEALEQSSKISSLSENRESIVDAPELKIQQETPVHPQPKPIILLEQELITEAKQIAEPEPVSNPSSVLVATPQTSESTASQPTSAPVAYQQAEKSNSTLIRVIVILLLVLCGVGGFLFFKNINNEDKLTKVEKMYFESALGVCSYTGTIDEDNLPDGTGEATFTDGRFYRGSFVHGNLNGNDAYFLYDNGDVFEGTFVDNKFSEGKYTIKSDGSYFEGSFENGQPSQGLWFDKDGKNLISQ